MSGALVAPVGVARVSSRHRAWVTRACWSLGVRCDCTLAPLLEAFGFPDCCRLCRIEQGDRAKRSARAGGLDPGPSSCTWHAEDGRRVWPWTVGLWLGRTLAWPLPWGIKTVTPRTDCPPYSSERVLLCALAPLTLLNTA